MADDIESALSALEEKAPLTAEPGDDDYIAHPLSDDDAGGAPPVTEADGDGEKPKPAEAKAKPPADDLPLDEIRKRWTDQKGATAKEREQRRAAEARAEAAEAAAAKIRMEAQALVARIQAGQNQAPDPEVDIVAAFKHQRAQIEAYQQGEAQRAQQAQQLAQQNAFVNGLKSKVDDFETEFKAEHPDYDEATDYLLDNEQERLEMLGYTRPVAAKMAEAFAINVAKNLLAAGKNPAETAYALAQKMGFKPKGVDPVDPTIAAAAAQAAAGAQSADKLAQVRAGQKAAQTLSGGGTGKSGYDGSIKAIVNLEGAAFDDAFEKFMKD